MANEETSEEVLLSFKQPKSLPTTLCTNKHTIYIASEECVFYKEKTQFDEINCLTSWKVLRRKIMKPAARPSLSGRSNFLSKKTGSDKVGAVLRIFSVCPMRNSGKLLLLNFAGELAVVDEAQTVYEQETGTKIKEVATEGNLVCCVSFANSLRIWKLATDSVSLELVRPEPIADVLAVAFSDSAEVVLLKTDGNSLSLEVAKLLPQLTSKSALLLDLPPLGLKKVEVYNNFLFAFGDFCVVKCRFGVNKKLKEVGRVSSVEKIIGMFVFKKKHFVLTRNFGVISFDNSVLPEKVKLIFDELKKRDNVILERFSYEEKNGFLLLRVRNVNFVHLVKYSIKHNDN